PASGAGSSGARVRSAGAGSGGTAGAAGHAASGGSRSPTGGADAGGTAGSADGPAVGPCDIYASGSTPCVAAHSTVRALYGSYDGKLYQVRRASDDATKDIGVLRAGGFASAATQDMFCSGTTCVITTVFDQSGHANHLEYQGEGSSVGGRDKPASAT